MSLLIYGTLIGMVYGSWAVSFSIIYRPVRIFHVMHAAVFTAAAYACWYIATITGSLVAGIATGLIAAVALGVLSELLIYRPLIRLNVRHGLLFVTSLAAYIIIENLIQLVWQADTRITEGPLALEARFRLGGVGIGAIEIVEAVVALGLWLLTLALLRFSLFGKAIRAVSTAPDMAELAGIHVDTIRLVAFCYGSLLIGISGILFLLKSGIEPASGLPVWIVAVVASLMSRADPFWSYVAGFVIGLCESVMLIWLPATWQPTIPVLVLLGYLLFLAGKHQAETMVARNHAKRAIKDA